MESEEKPLLTLSVSFVLSQSVETGGRPSARPWGNQLIWPCWLLHIYGLFTPLYGGKIYLLRFRKCRDGAPTQSLTSAAVQFFVTLVYPGVVINLPFMCLFQSKTWKIQHQIVSTIVKVNEDITDQSEAFSCLLPERDMDTEVGDCNKMFLTLTSVSLRSNGAIRR